ncbi:MAG TPA: hypothetical protein VKE74_00865, partial [Gemmataceae bacterium]|nr:hypothetical protein [Gemmataceae bacterium]
RIYFDPPATKHLWQWFNQTWGTNVTKEEWAEFDPERATVGDYCRLVASRTRRPVIRPWRSPAGECLPAGAFLTVRSLLADAGADPNGITPSAPLAPYHSRLGRIAEHLARLAPGRRPRFRYRYPYWVLAAVCAGCVLVPLACLVGLITFAVGLRTTAWILGGAQLAASIGVGVLMRVTRSPRVDPDHVRTFRDLAYHLTGQEPRRSIQPTP